MQVSLWPGGPTLRLEDRWKPFRTRPGDPADAQAIGYKFTDGTIGVVNIHATPPEVALPLDRQEVIDNLRGSPDAGLIDVGLARTASGIPYIYSLMKIRQEPSGVQYNLTLQLSGEHRLQIQGNFLEGDVTGIREAVVYEIAMSRNMLSEPTEDDPTGGWAHDPFDHSTAGFVMNISELPDFDERFPSHPLSMARELLRVVAAS
jgi:hypothetical protein